MIHGSKYLNRCKNILQDIKGCKASKRLRKPCFTVFNVLQVLQDDQTKNRTADLLRSILTDFQGLTYVADHYKESFNQVNNGMFMASETFESLKRK
jgi:hypothetical protein